MEELRPDSKRGVFDKLLKTNNISMTDNELKCEPESEKEKSDVSRAHTEVKTDGQ